MRKTWILGGVVVLFYGSPAWGCVLSGRTDGQLVGYDKIFINTSSLSASMKGFVRNAAVPWNDADCNKPVANAHYTYDFPILATENGQGSGRTIDVIYVMGFNPSNDESCGSFSGNTIRLYERMRLNGVPKLCNSEQLMTDTISHELGHLLGLADQYDPSCSGHIMGQRTYTSGGAYVDRSVRPEECQKVAETNKTPAEQYAGECAANPSICSPDNQCGYIPEYSHCSPIVLDLGRDGFKFSGPDQPVSFDIDADTVKEKICWIGPRTNEVFLAMDRNGNGWIDDGSELFGDSTPFLNGEPAQNGYQVLFELDLARGNGNGFLDRGDLDFERLLLWHDWNRDGKSQPWELTPVSATDIYAIAVEYSVSLERDQHGNSLRFRSNAFRSGAGTAPPSLVPTVDVFFAPGH